jgi:hypothetical protein
MSERSERALREALGALPPDESVDLDGVRRRAADRRRGGQVVAGVAIALVLVAGVIGVPRLFPADQGQSVAAGGAAQEAEPQGQPEARADSPTAPEESAPDGWRTEYYRDVSFQVPDRWGYAVPPQSDWCADEPRGQPRADQRRPYVWLATAIVVRAIGCPARPASLHTEHVEALPPGPAVDYVEGAIKEGDWWVVTRFAGNAVLVVTTKQRALAEQILASAEVEPAAAPCAPTSPVSGPLGARPRNDTDLAQLPPVEEVVLCQYEPVVDPVDAELPRLRATVRLTGSRAQALVSGLAAAPVNTSSCDPAPLDGLPQLAVVARVRTGDRTSDIHIAAAGCPDGDAGMAGGIDDGTTLRLLTPQACRLVLTPPIALFAGSGDVGRNCLG